ncbi:hypothetical protein MD484_g4898, partial [Candolleomyces efflorescens]
MTTSTFISSATPPASSLPESDDRTSYSTHEWPAREALIAATRGPPLSSQPTSPAMTTSTFVSSPIAPPASTLPETDERTSYLIHQWPDNDDEINWGEQPPPDQDSRGHNDKPSQVVRTDAKGNPIKKPLK